MATSVDYIEYVYDFVKKYGFVRYKKMFGEYMIYVDEKPILLVCDNVVYVKKHEEIKDIMQSADTGFPYSGAKESYILDVENISVMDELVPILVRITPFPKVKTKKEGKKHERSI